MKNSSFPAIFAAVLFSSVLADDAHTSRLTLEQSTDLRDWQPVPIDPEMLDDEGNVLVPSDESAGFYRLRVELPEPPAISSQPQATTLINEGDSLNLSVEATGGALAWQWFLGESGDTSQPIDGATEASLDTGELFEDTTYWVRVTNPSGSVNSQAFTVLVGSLAPDPEEFATIPAGEFTMGRTSGDTDSNAPPVNVFVSEFHIARHQVTWQWWNNVRDWAEDNGYTDIDAGGGKGVAHPVHSVNWWDVVKWCNARSEREGLIPVYRNADGTVFRNGTTAPTADWSANGYRLPTEAEWEKAARGGVAGQRFPWGDTITHSRANYWASTQYSYDNSPTVAAHPDYFDNPRPFTSPVGSFAPNGFGLHDMAGNVWEWCWDWYSPSAYTEGATDPRGADWSLLRSLRGGGWSNGAFYNRSAYRNNFVGIGERYENVGFRLVRSAAP